MKKTICLVSLFIVALFIMTFTSCSEKTPSSLISNNSEKFYITSNNDNEIITTELFETDDETVNPSNNDYLNESNQNELIDPKAFANSLTMPSEELLDIIRSDFINSKKIKDDELIYVSRYYGEYDGAIPVEIEGAISRYLANKDEIIAGYLFHYNDYNTIRVWKDGQFFTIESAFENGILTEKQVGILAYIHENNKYISFSNPYDFITFY